MANQLFLRLENRPKLKGNWIDRKGFIFGPYNSASVGRYGPVPCCLSAPWLQTLEMTMLSGLSRSTVGDGWKQNRAYVAFLKIMPEENWLGESKMSTNVVIGRACHQNRNFFKALKTVLACWIALFTALYTVWIAWMLQCLVTSCGRIWSISSRQQHTHYIQSKHYICCAVMLSAIDKLTRKWDCGG